MSLGQNPNIVDGFGNAVKADETGLHITAKPGTTVTINGQAIQVGPATHGPNDYAAVPDLALGDGAGGASIVFDSVKAGSIVLTDGAGDAIELDGTSGVEITAGAGGLKLNGAPINSGGIIQVARTTIPSAKLLSSASVIVVPAPGMGKYIVPISMFYNYKFGTIAYAALLGQTMAITIGGSAIWSQCDAANFMDQLADQVCTPFASTDITPSPSVATGFSPGNPGGPSLESTLDNAALEFSVDSGGLTLGDGTLDVIIFYYIATKA